MAKLKLNGYDSYSGCDIIVTARLNSLSNTKNKLKEKIYTLGSLQTLSISTHQDRKPVRVIGSVNALDYVMGQRTIAGSLVFAVFDKHFASEMFNDLKEATGNTFLLPDELPGLDLTITFANEYGKKSRMAIYGVRIINEGQVMSINDLYTENTYQFVATSMEPLKKGIKTGSSSNVNTQTYVTSSLNTNIERIPVTGETIYNKTESEYGKNISRVSLIANIEQPTTYKQEGIVTLHLSPTKTTGTISILDKKKDKVIIDIPVLSTTNQYSAFLTASDYTAWYHDNNQILSNTVSFAINEVLNLDYSYNDAPIIENVTNNSIIALSNNPSHTIGVCVDLNTLNEQETDINSRIFKFINLKNNNDYIVYTKTNDAISKPVNVTTLYENNESLSIYKNYVRTNKNLLSKDFSSYEPILNKLVDDNFLYALTKENSIEAKELIYMAVKYKNEFTTIINSEYESMPIKKEDSIYGNVFKFNTGVAKANIFLNKNKKDYFESSESYPTEINYIGKSNSLYNVVSVNNNFVKSPKYSFYVYSDNDKAIIKQQFGNINVLNNLETKQLTNVKLSNKSLLCLTAKDNKNKDMNLLRAPKGIIDKNNNLIVNLNYKDILGEKENTYYLCISKLEECLDKTPFRKITVQVKYDTMVIENLSTAINKNDIFALWIEDEQFNIISDLGFTSYSEDIYDLNSYIIEQDVANITKKIETSLNKSNYLSDVSSSIDYDTINEKDIYNELACLFLNNKEVYAYDLILELFKIKFNNICTNKDKFKKVVYNQESKVIAFENAKDVELVQIAFKKDVYSINIINDNKATVDNSYDINIFYLISSNPVIKSGFVIVGNTRADSYLINLEVI